MSQPLAALALRETDGGVILPVKAVPNASRDKLAGLLGDALKVTTAAAPEAGKANKAIATFLARKLKLPKSAVQLHAGASNPRKEFRIEGLCAGDLRTALATLL
ncbi:MAG: DUF167 domain-containing protein [Phycisphaerales bacterium]|jgi:uncharacterized protein|nr:DUF167 domain-containing protein [Phycisphaerales bacterium]MBT7170831.1 DUF167 domain-containing protein [Phycisphaerales bacterium]